MFKRIAALVLTVIAAGALLGGTTVARFTGNTGSSGSTFTAGTLKVELTDAGGQPLSAPIMTFDKMVPGDISDPAYQAYVTNTGNVPLVYNFALVRQGAGGPSADALAGALNLKVERETDTGWVTVAEHTVTDWVGAGASAWQPKLEANEKTHFRYTAALPRATGNPPQGGSITLTLLVSATQPSVLAAGGVLSGTWRGSYSGTWSSNPQTSDGSWPFVALVTQTGSSFTGTMTEPSVPTPSAISGTLTGSTINGHHTDYGADFTGTLQPGGTVTNATWTNWWYSSGRPWWATRQ